MMLKDPSQSHKTSKTKIKNEMTMTYENRLCEYLVTTGNTNIQHTTKIFTKAYLVLKDLIVASSSSVAKCEEEVVADCPV